MANISRYINATVPQTDNMVMADGMRILPAFRKYAISKPVTSNKVTCQSEI